eukprot:Em0009g8a
MLYLSVLLKGSDIKRTSRRTVLLKGSDIKRASRRTVLLKGSDIKRASRRTVLLKGSDIERALRRTVLLKGGYTGAIQLPLRQLEGVGIGRELPQPPKVSSPDPDSQQLRVDYITATWKVGLGNKNDALVPSVPKHWDGCVYT